MIYRTFKQNKLWRDKIIETVEQRDGSRVHWRTLDDAAFDQQLRVKLLEETHEVVNTQNIKELIEELADVYEVIDTLAQLHGITKDAIIAAQTTKREQRGGFMGRRFVETSDHAVGSISEQYCLATPEKYPEIKKRLKHTHTALAHVNS